MSSAVSTIVLKQRVTKDLINYTLGTLVRDWKPKHKNVEERLSEARRYFEAASKVRGGNIDVMSELALAEVLSLVPGESQRAAGILHEVIGIMERRDSNSHDATHLLGQAYELLGNIAVEGGDIASARTHYYRALAVMPSDRVQIYLGLTQHESERKLWFEKALKELQQQPPDSPSIGAIHLTGKHVLRIIAAHESGADDIADQYFRQAIQLGDEIRMHSLQPLFLSPLSKRRQTIEELLAELTKYLSPSKKF
jgi:hypothetical protein